MEGLWRSGFVERMGSKQCGRKRWQGKKDGGGEVGLGTKW